MKAFSFSVAALAFFILLYGSVFSQTRLEILFIASEEELQLALNNPDDFKALAISGDFYRKSSPHTQRRLEAVARYILGSNTLRPVFLYGLNLNSPDLDPSMIKRIFGDLYADTDKDCKSPALAGIFLTFRIRDVVGATVKICGSVDGEFSEEEFRSWITNYWLEAKRELANDGYATIP
jgi:hypothetical protein